MGVDYKELTKQVLDISTQVRFAGVVNSKGELVASEKKEDVEPLLDNDQVKMSIHYALQKRDLYTNLAYKIGNETAAITEYEKVTMISIPINSNELFLVSTEPRADYLAIIDYVRSELKSQKESD